MSRPEIPGQPRERRTPAEQIRHFVEAYRGRVEAAALARVTARVREWGLAFTEEELLIVAALDTPAKVQAFFNAELYYNNDHAADDLEETARPPRQVLCAGAAHCFEGALFAIAVNELHGHAPRLVLLEGSQDSEHNLVVFQDPATGLWGSNAHSGYPHLDGRPAEYPTLRALAESYYPYYYSDYTHDPNDRTLVGYSEPIDVIAKYGTAWMGSEEPLWDIYYTYVDADVRLHYLFDDSGESHLYPVIRALQERWIQLDGHGEPAVCASNLPPPARALWDAFWPAYDPKEKHARGRAREIEKEFMRLTGTTPVDLQDNADDLQYYLAAGYRIEQLGVTGLFRGT